MWLTVVVATKELHCCCRCELRKLRSQFIMHQTQKYNFRVFLRLFSETKFFLLFFRRSCKLFLLAPCTIYKNDQSYLFVFRHLSGLKEIYESLVESEWTRCRDTQILRPVGFPSAKPAAVIWHFGCSLGERTKFACRMINRKTPAALPSNFSNKWDPSWT